MKFHELILHGNDITVYTLRLSIDTVPRIVANTPLFVITAKLFSVARYVARGLKSCRKTSVRDPSDKKRLLAVQQETEERKGEEERRFVRLTANEGAPQRLHTTSTMFRAKRM